MTSPERTDRGAMPPSDMGFAGQVSWPSVTAVATTTSATERDGSRAPAVPMLQIPAKLPATARAALTAAAARPHPYSVGNGNRGTAMPFPGLF